MPEEGSVRISVVIPTLNAGGQIDRLLSLLEKQTVKPEEILVIDSASTDDTLEQAAKHFGVKTLTIPRASFNHGGTRDEGVKRTRGEIIIFLTQDAIPASEQMIEHLTAPLKKDALIIAAYGRQLPREKRRADF